MLKVAENLVCLYYKSIDLRVELLILYNKEANLSLGGITFAHFFNTRLYFLKHT